MGTKQREIEGCNPNLVTPKRSELMSEGGRGRGSGGKLTSDKEVGG